MLIAISVEIRKSKAFDDGPQPMAGVRESETFGSFQHAGKSRTWIEDAKLPITYRVNG